MPDEWKRVIFSADCDEEGNCPQCGIDYADCECPGPTMEDEYEYRERDGILEARARGEFASPQINPARM